MEISGSDGIIFSYDTVTRDCEINICPEIWWKDQTILMEAINTIMSMHLDCAYCDSELDINFVCTKCNVTFAPYVYNDINLKLS